MVVKAERKVEVVSKSKTSNGAQGVEQIHIRMRTEDAALLRQLAVSRDQTLSAVVRFLLHYHLRRQPDG